MKDLFKLKYHLLIDGREKVGIKKSKNPKPFIDYSQSIDDVYEKLEDKETKRVNSFWWYASRFGS